MYFDHAASSFPKPEAVVEAVSTALMEYSANPGRGGHQLAVRAADVIYQTRLKLAKMFHLKNPRNVLFYQNATVALNQAIKGMKLERGDHIITTTYEHNSVRRPLEFLQREKGITITYLPPNEDGDITATRLRGAVTEKTRAVVVSHGSNVTGAITPLEEISEVTKEHQLTFIVDASQTAGVLPINMEELAIDMLAFPGHKGLLGPQGTGALLIQDDVELLPLVHGGTGSHSEVIDQPLERPQRYESGTLNTPGIAGLSAGIDEVNSIGLDEIFAHELSLTYQCIDGLEQIASVRVFGPNRDQKRLAVIPFVIEGVDVHEVATILDQHYQVAVRAGLHCSPIAHETVGTIDGGTLRVSFGHSNTSAEVETFIQSIKEITEGLLG
ncbi:aminotransferase class V-fold PLP-dependent enzyme [Desertibacillus haloalkaliphilus]|nr:aminotransferase class V-fold PLP-dependent enzyme [Desertibacillus haloalkaliphilus]